MTILFIGYNNPLLGIPSGGDLGSASNLKLLRKLVGETNISEYYIHPYNTGKSMPIKMFGVLIDFLKGYYYGLSPKRAEELVEKAKGFDAVFIDRSIFGIIAPKLRNTGYKGKIVTFFHNVEPVYFAAKIGWKPWRPIVTCCVAKNERQACDASDKIIALNPRDNNEIKKRYGRSADFLSPVVMEDHYNAGPEEGLTSQKPLCLFIGSYFPMNADGILWFIREVFPKVNIRLQIIGKGMEALQGQFTPHPDIELLGSVGQLEPYYHHSDFLILPIFSGSGMKVKTCEGLMYGKNILGTAEAFEGYDLEPDRTGGYCNSDKEFIEKLSQYAKCPIPRFNRYSREVYLKNYSYESRERIFRNVLNLESKEPEVIE